MSRTVLETIVFTCFRVKSYDPIDLQLGLANVSIPAIQTKGAYFKQLFALISVALGPLISIFKLAGLVSAMVDMLKASLTLDAAKMAEAFEQVVKLIAAVLGLVPQTAIPKFIYDLLRLFVQLLDVLIDELTAITEWEQMFVPNPYNSEVLECLEENLTTIKAQKMKEIGSFLLILNPINDMMKLIGLDEIASPEMDNFDDAITALTRLKQTLQVITGDI